MIIKSLYINKFGVISGKTINFNDSINVICSDNETGKSTIAEFIKIMLYGIPTRGVKNIRGNERVKYMPWGENKMGGEMTVIAGDTEYTIIRSFGKRKSEDAVTVINSLTGETEKELSTEAPGEKLLGVGREGFEKTLYIKQLSSRIEPDKEDEILNKLINLAQSGDEETSFQRAVSILDAAAKELSGSRPKGKMLILQDEITNLLEKRSKAESMQMLVSDLSVKLKRLTAEKARLEAYSPDRTYLEKLKKEYSDALVKQTRQNKKHAEMLGRKIFLSKIMLFALVLCFAASLVLVYFKPFFSFPFFILAAIFSVLLYKVKSSKTQCENTDIAGAVLKKVENEETRINTEIKQNTSSIIELTRQISDIQNQIENMDMPSVGQIDEMIARCKEKYNYYGQCLNDINLAKSCLQQAFEELQKSFGKRLNEETSKIIKEITGGKYVDVLVDNEYNMQVRKADTNELVDAQYLSNGTYDQIYFALRLGIVHMLFDNVPIILDEAFVQYDDNRLRAVMEYIKNKENRQILLFSCHKREKSYIN